MVFGKWRVKSSPVLYFESDWAGASLCVIYGMLSLEENATLNLRHVLAVVRSSLVQLPGASFSFSSSFRTRFVAISALLFFPPSLTNSGANTTFLAPGLSRGGILTTEGRDRGNLFLFFIFTDRESKICADCSASIAFHVFVMARFGRWPTGFADPWVLSAIKIH